MKTSQIRKAFLDYFCDLGHSVVDSASLIPYQDQSLLFTNAGMVPFKQIFTGQEKASFSRATSSQKCVRAGGKHNDLDQVGYTARHHTFFEMLGNFSFGDYFKNEAIPFAWNFITKELGLDSKRLLVTVYHEDEEAKEIWKKVAGNITIIPIATSDNFWSMGDTGPCGPCSEIFYDHGDKIFGGPPGTQYADGDRFVEIWNIVFMQYNQLSGGIRENLPKKSIDTGMGLERIAAVMQGVCDNYDIDVFRNIICCIKEITGAVELGNNRFSFKAIADHVRACSFLIADGVLPGNEGRGYVLRRILRRAVRHGNLLGVNEPFLHKIVPSVISEMCIPYTQLVENRDFIISTVKSEEEKFCDTLVRGMKILESDVQRLGTGGCLSGELAFRLYDTYGFPLDLTEDILKPMGYTVDNIGFDACMKQQRDKANWKNHKDQLHPDVNNIFRDCKSEFVGHNCLNSQANIVGIIVNGQAQDKIEFTNCDDSEEIYIILDKTSTYAEAGGQVGDHGVIKCGDCEFKIWNTVKLNSNVIGLKGKIISGNFAVGDHVCVSVDKDFRESVAVHHSSTHLLHAALRKILGGHVVQRGSYVCDELLRFDFAHTSSVNPTQLRDVENLVNSWCLRGLEFKIETMSKDAATKIGAMALFDEKYGEVVRVVSVCDNDSQEAISVELCGGTHVKNTSAIGIIKIISESSVGSGVRRIEAVAAKKAINYINKIDDELSAISDTLKCSRDNVLLKVQSLLDNSKKYEKQVSDLMRKNSDNSGDFCLKNIGDVQVKFGTLSNVKISDLRGISDEIKNKLKSGIVVLACINDSNVSFVVNVTKNLINSFDAKDILLHSITKFGGSGGGRAEFAQGGGIKQIDITEAFICAERHICGKK